MKCLGVDYGESRVGIAISDDEGKIAFPRKTVSAKTVIREIKSLVKKESIKKVIVGLPLSLGNRETDQTKAVRKFAKELHLSLTIPVEFENEIFTTRMAEKAQVKKEHADAAAAAIILQSYLDKKKR